MKTVIIFIHGMGNKPNKSYLKKYCKLSICDGLESIDKEFLSFKLISVYWAHILHNRPLNEVIINKTDPLYMHAYEPERSESHKKRLRNFMRKCFIKTIHITTVPLEIILEKIPVLEPIENNILNHFPDLHKYYYGSGKVNDEEQKVKDMIMETLKRALLKHKHKKIMLIAHSMGSIIAYDVLTQVLRDQKITTFVTLGSPLGWPTIKKFIRMQTDNNPGRKRKLRTPENLTDNWFNIYDSRDRVAKNPVLKAVFNTNPNEVFPRDKSVTNDYCTEGKDEPHKLYGYMRTEEFAQIVHDFISTNESKLNIMLMSFKHKLKGIFNSIMH